MDVTRGGYLQMTVNVSSSSGSIAFNGNPVGNGPQQWAAFPPLSSEVSLGLTLEDSVRRVTAKPDHEFNPPSLDINGRPYLKDKGGTRRPFCQDCAPGCIWMDDPSAHLYVIREWEIG